MDEIVFRADSRKNFLIYSILIILNLQVSYYSDLNSFNFNIKFSVKV